MLMATNSHLSADRTPAILEGKLKNQSNLLTGSPSSGVSPSPNVRQPVGEKKANGEMAAWATPTVSRVIITPTEAVTKALSWVWDFHKEKTKLNPRETDSIRILFRTQDVKFNFAPSWFLKSTIGLKYTRKHLVPVGNTQTSLSE